MKRIIPLLIIFVVGLCFTACQNDPKTAEKPKVVQKKNQKKKNQQKKNQKKKQQKKNQQKKPADTAKAKALPPISKLKKSDKVTTARIRMINDQKIKSDMKTPPRITDDVLKIAGVAIDKPQKTAAAGVYLKIGEKFYKTNYGQPNKAIVKSLKNPKYLKSNFRIQIPTAGIKKGNYDVGIFVVSSDRKTYYEVKDKVAIKIR